MKRSVTDVRRTLSYGHEKMAVPYVIIGALSFMIGVYGMFYAHDFSRQPMYWLALAAGAACLAYGFYRTAIPGQLLKLSPAGIHLHIDMVKTVLIPWHEVHAVERTDITVPYRGGTATFPNVTVAVVSEGFYDPVIHADSLLLRGPGWDAWFIHKDGMVQVALHHDVIPAKAEELHSAVMARWTAFRDAGRTRQPAGSP
jgi:hypothetical protein